MRNRPPYNLAGPVRIYLTQAEIERLLMRISSVEAEGSITPEDRSAKQKLLQALSMHGVYAGRGQVIPPLR